MEDLNAQQIVLLTLLVSFVTSIATGITTVSLLEQAPEPVTQTINRVVEKTVERVVTEPSENTVVERVVETVVVNEEDLTIEAVEKNSRSLVRIYPKGNDLVTPVALGVVVNSSGDILTGSASISPNSDYVAKYVSGEYEVTADSQSANGLISLSISNPVEGDTFSPAVFANSDNIKLGQSIITLSGQSSNTVSTGIVQNINTSIEGVNTSIVTSVPNPQLIGSIILNLQGEIIGIKDNTVDNYLPANVIKEYMLSGELSFLETVVETEE